jgi:hypothetical protein
VTCGNGVQTRLCYVNGVGYCPGDATKPCFSGGCYCDDPLNNDCLPTALCIPSNTTYAH